MTPESKPQNTEGLFARSQKVDKIISRVTDLIVEPGGSTWPNNLQLANSSGAEYIGSPSYILSGACISNKYNPFLITCPTAAVKARRNSLCCGFANSHELLYNTFTISYAIWLNPNENLKSS